MPLVPLLAPQKERYARHLLLPEIGVQGQMRLCNSTFAAASTIDSADREVCAEYLKRAGLKSNENGASGEGEDSAAVTMAIIAGDVREAIRCISDDPALKHALSFFLGSVCAVETIKDALAKRRPVEGGH